MKLSIQIVTLCLALLFSTADSFAGRKKKGKKEDLSRIVLNAHVPASSSIPSSAKRILETKIAKLASNNGVGGSTLVPRFVIVPTIVELTKDVTPTAPPMVALTLEVTFFVGDGMEGTIFSNASLEVKGVGTNENKAYTEALKQITVENEDLISMIETGRSKIIQHYENNCDFILKEAEALRAQKEHEKAILLLMSVPDVCKECYEKCLEAVKPIYQEHIDRQCESALVDARNIWSAEQNIASAEKAAKILATIDPDAACFEDIKKLNKDIEKKVAEIDDREWEYTLTDQEQQGDSIDAIKEVGVAYGNNQPEQVVYSERIGEWGQ